MLAHRSGSKLAPHKPSMSSCAAKKENKQFSSASLYGPSGTCQCRSQRFDGRALGRTDQGQALSSVGQADRAHGERRVGRTVCLRHVSRARHRAQELPADGVASYIIQGLDCMMTAFQHPKKARKRWDDVWGCQRSATIGVGEEFQSASGLKKWIRK